MDFQKEVRSSFGEDSIKVLRDRNACLILWQLPSVRTDLIKLKLSLSLYANVMSNSNIEADFCALWFCCSLTISRWQTHYQWYCSLTKSSFRTSVWSSRVEIIHKVREISKMANKTVYITLVVKRDGKKEVPGLWWGKSESSAFWVVWCPK